MTEKELNKIEADLEITMGNDFDEIERIILNDIDLSNKIKEWLFDILHNKQDLKKCVKNVINDYKKVLKENEELKKYDIRNIKIDKDKIISSPSFTRKEVNLMNLGIALSLNADKLFNEEIEEDDI